LAPELQKRLDNLRAEREAKFEAVLTRDQKQMLAQEEQQKKAAAAARKAAGKASAKEKASN
jgi:Spy/CpxP family protein refolding chaperone